MNKRIIPILVDDAPPLVADTLPDEIKDLASINAVFARHVSFDHDVGVILNAIIAEAPEGWLRRFLNRNPSVGAILRVAGGLGSGLLLLWWTLLEVHDVVSGGETLEQTLWGNRALVVVVAIVIVLTGSVAFWRLTRPRKERAAYK